MSYLGPGDVMLEPIIHRVHSHIKINAIIDYNPGDIRLNTCINGKFGYSDHTINRNNETLTEYFDIIIRGQRFFC